MLQGRPEDLDAAIADAESVRDRYRAIWRELHLEPALPAGDRHAIRAQLRRLNDLGFAVDEIEIVPAAGGAEVKLRVTTSNRAFHAHELERLTGLHALEGQARILLNDLREYRAWLELREGRHLTDAAAARRWRRELLNPALRRLRPVIGERDVLQAYCDVLERKWLLSEQVGHDVGLDAAIANYLEEGAPAPETDVTSDPDGSVPPAVDDLLDAADE